MKTLNCFLRMILRPGLQLQKAEAELAYELQAAKTKQRIKEENMQIKASAVLNNDDIYLKCRCSGD